MRVKYKICCLAYNVLHNKSPSYLSNMVKTYAPNRSLRSEGDNLLSKPKTTRKIGEQAFSFSAPQFWNLLPKHIRHAPSLDIFKSNLKTFLFNQERRK